MPVYCQSRKCKTAESKLNFIYCNYSNVLISIEINEPSHKPSLLTDTVLSKPAVLNIFFFGLINS